MNLDPLYKKTSTGAIQYWKISVEGTTIKTEFGQVGTDNPQETSDIISVGKNIGKANETTPEEQATAEALAKWENKLKTRGYVQSIDGAVAEETDDSVEGGVVPMLAHKFAEQGHKIKYPCFVQRKLDGIRCIAIVKDGKATLWSRTRKPIISCPHIIQELEQAFRSRDGTITLDGELYVHEMRNEFEKIVSLVRKEYPGSGHEKIEYHVYDIISDESFRDRNNKLDSLFSTAFTHGPIKRVQTETVSSEADVMGFFDSFLADGYEGAMLRNANSPYVNKRSYDLQKMKVFQDSEFDIIGIEEGRGKLAGHAIFVCETDQGKEFSVKMRGEISQLREYFEDHDLWKGKQLTVQYQGLTGKEGVPRFPVGVTVRNYE